MGGVTGRYNGIQRRFGGWYVEWCSISCKVEGWVVEESQVGLVVSPRAGDSHKVGGEFVEDQFQLLMRRLPLDTCQDRMWHLGLDTVGGHSIGHGCSI
jgi:hypothetical protein